MPPNPLAFATNRAARAGVAAAAAVACAASASAAGKLGYAKYLELEDAAKAKLVRRYVRSGEDGYHVVSVSNYQVHTEVSPEFALRTAFLMDDFHATFAAAFRGRFARDERPRVYVLENRASYLAFMRKRGMRAKWTAGMFLPRGPLLASYRRSGKLPRHILFHEGAHQLLWAYIGRGRVPLWFNEGVATNFESWDLEHDAPGHVRLVVLLSARRRRAVDAVRKGEALPLEKLLTITGAEWRSQKNRPLNYAMAWSLVNFLLSTERGQRKLNLMLAALRKGGGLGELLTPQVRRELERQWLEDVKTRMALYEDFLAPAHKLAGDKEPDRAAELAGKGVAAHPQVADGRFWRGWFLVEAGRHAEALADLRFAEKADPEFPGLSAALGRACLETGDGASARRHLARAVRRNPLDSGSRRLLEGLKER